MAWSEKDYEKVPGTYVFNGRRSLVGYQLNKMCMSLNDAENREEVKRDPEAYCRKFGLSDEQTKAVIELDALELLRLGGNIYYLAKLAGAFGMNVQDVGAQMSGITVEEFRERLQAAARGEWKDG
jgi:protocatechuate 4,5-dioxygenase, alpha chain